jgi:hypothetical protein
MARNSVKILEKNFSDMKAGDKMLIASPEMITSYISKIPKGETVTPRQMRLDLAKQHHADNSCPVSTGIFLRMAIEQSLDGQQLKPASFPFWRIIDEKHPIVEKLGLCAKQIKEMREQEWQATRHMISD